MKILNKTGEIIAEFDVENLRGADLCNANLPGANLRGADLCGAEIIIITFSLWTAYITNGHIKIGCQSHKLEDWINFSNTEISEMDSKALDFWKENKELIIGLCKRFKSKNHE